MPGESGPRAKAVLLAHALIGLAGLSLMILAAAMGPGWADRHLLPTFTWPRSVQIGFLQAARAALVLTGLLLILVARPRVARAIGGGRGRQLLGFALSASIAVAAAAGTAEAVLRTRKWQSIQERWDSKEPIRVRDVELGWVYRPSHQGTKTQRGRPVHYATNRFGYRARSLRDEPDFSRPSILLAGESILSGYALDWPDTIGARLEAITGVQTVNLAVNGYGTDQALLRLKREMPRFRNPRAAIILFTPFLLDRNLDHDRPYLDARLRWHSFEPPTWRLVELGRRMVRYRSEARIAEGVEATRAVLRAFLDLARARGARGIVLVPQFGPENPAERMVRRRVLDEGGIPYLFVRLDAARRVADDRHPDAQGAQAIAAAVARALGEDGGKAE